MNSKTGKTTAYVVGATISAAFLAVIGWGQVRKVTVPQPATWGHVPTVCASGEGVDAAALRRAVTEWRDHGHPVRLDCNAPDVLVTLDPGLEGGTDWNAEDPEHALDDLPQTWGVTRCQALDGELLSCTIRVHPRAEALAYTHELGHALGYQHPPLCPSGHLMHPSRPGWDWRGLGGP